jgi:hypothetical protein
VTLRKWFASALATGSTIVASAGFAPAAEPAKAETKSAFAFGLLKTMPAADAKAKVEAWLKSTGKFDQTKFDAVWAQSERSVADLTTESIALGLPGAGAALAATKQTDAPAGTLPDVLKDAKLDAFVKTNLAAAYAKTLAAKRAYEESLEAAKAVTPEQLADPASFYFYKAVAEHGTIRRDAALSSLVRLLEDVTDAPDRYKAMAYLMFFDIQSWSKDEKDLANIGRLMDNSGRRLELARAGTQTQEIQKKIVFRLDEKIKQLENKKKGGGGGGSCDKPGECEGEGCPDGGKPGSGGANAGGPPQGPAGDSYNGGMAGEGKVDEKKLRQYADTWGKLPADKRAEAIREITRDVPPKFRPQIEEFFKSLNRVNGYGN